MMMKQSQYLDDISGSECARDAGHTLDGAGSELEERPSSHPRHLQTSLQSTPDKRQRYYTSAINMHTICVVDKGSEMSAEEWSGVEF
jgi:hypothetical protein